MNAGEIILLALKISIVLTVFVIGLDSTFAEAISLFRQPAKLLRSLLSMNVVMLLLAVLLAAVFNLHPAVKIALVALALSPVPPFLPIKVHKAGGTESYIIGLLTAAALLAIAVIPLSLKLLQTISNKPLGMPPSMVAKVVLTTVLAPLLLGIALRSIAPALAKKIRRPLSLLGTVMMVVSSLPLIVFSWSTIWSLVGNGTVVVLAFFAIAGLATGHLLGGPSLRDRTVLALCTATRHPGMAIGIAHVNFSEEKLAMPAILLYLIISTIVSVPYLQLLKRRRAVIDANKNSEGLKQTTLSL